jgi:hypothetical protein
MQLEKLTAERDLADAAALGAPPDPAADRLPLLHAAASRARAAAAIAAAVRVVRGHARQCRRAAQVLSVIMRSSGPGRERA